MHAQQVVLRGTESRYGKLFLINAWPVPRGLMLQSDKRESDGAKREGELPGSVGIRKEHGGKEGNRGRVKSRWEESKVEKGGTK